MKTSDARSAGAGHSFFHFCKELFFSSINSDFVTYLTYAFDPGHGFLGNLFPVVARQAASQKKHTVLPFTRDSPYVEVRAFL